MLSKGKSAHFNFFEVQVQRSQARSLLKIENFNFSPQTAKSTQRQTAQQGKVEYYNYMATANADARGCGATEEEKCINRPGKIPQEYKNTK